MNINFTYDKDKDVWCLLNKGKSSNNSKNSTKQYLLLTERYGENPTTKDIEAFINEYVTKNNIIISECIESFNEDWKSVSSEFQNRAESIFKISIPKEATAYLTINSRCPYSIEDNFFYVFLQSESVRKIAMHELWHFYTWYSLGIDQEEVLGKNKYNDLKESLTVLLNIECKDILPEGIIDIGYPQHQMIRREILEYWEKDKDIKRLWDYLINLSISN